MMNILLTGLLLVNACIFVLIVYAFLKIRRIYEEFRVFCTAPDEKTPSALASLAGVLSDMVARSIVACAKTTFMGKQSGAIRAGTGIEADIAEDTINANHPAIGALLHSFPALRRTLRRNPALLDMALSKLGVIGGGAVASPPGNSHGSQIDFKL